MFYQGGPIDHCIHVTVSVAQYSAENEYKEACNAGMAISHFRILNNDLLNKDPYVVPEQATVIILDIKSAICMDKNGEETNHIYRRMNFSRNGK